MYHNPTNQICVIALNHQLLDNPSPRYLQHASSSQFFDPSKVFLSSFLIFRIFILLLLIILGQVFIPIWLKRMAVTCLIQHISQNGMWNKVFENHQNLKFR